MKKILGLDLGSTSIGWALVNEAEKDGEKSNIIKTGVRILQLDNYVSSANGKESKDPLKDFIGGKGISPNAGRTQKRGMRRNLQRYKQRRSNLLEILRQHKILSEEKAIAEEGKGSTFELWELRARAAEQEIDLHDFARVLLGINKKRGYKSNRKAKDEGDGQAIDAMGLAKQLYERNLTPGQYVLELLKKGKKVVPDFYRSDLQSEFDAVWNHQKKYYPEILIDDLKGELSGKNKSQTWAICAKPFDIKGVKRTTKGFELKKENYQWRVDGLTKQLGLEELAIVLQEINNQTNSSSGYLGAISDRSKKLYFNQQTVGQNLYAQLKKNPHSRLKNQVFYRQDYLDEFEQIWEIQSANRKNILTDELKNEIRDVVIFYQRRLKSQKGMIAICELEGREIEITVDGKKKKKLIGPRVVPRSSPLFQEYKIWQILNNLKFENIENRQVYTIADLDTDLEVRKALFDELSVKGKLSKTELLKNVVDKPKEWVLKNFEEVEGNTTNAKLYEAFEKIANLSGHEVEFKKMSGSQIKEACSEVLKTLGISEGILDFNAELDGKAFEMQPAYQFWHLLYSYEGDDSKSGNDKLIAKLKEKFGIEEQFGRILANVIFQDDYSSLSAKAIRKILPELKEGKEYSVAAKLAGYNHSSYLTKEENEKRALNDFLELLPKNSLRNPVVEKILNQMVNVVNAIIKEYGRPDEIRVELARELKKSNKERAEMTSSIAASTKLYDSHRKELQKLSPFNQGVRITKNDLIKYRLWLELKSTGHKTIYTGAYVPLEKLFTKEFDIEHIIPKAVLFDDSFSNKTLSTRDFNRWKSHRTGIDAVAEKYGKGSDGYNEYLDRIEKIFNGGKGDINKAKYKKLLMTQKDIPEGFLERDLRSSQYIAKKAIQMLLTVCRTVTPTTGSVTDKLREDWQLINVLRELNWEKYDRLGLTYYEVNKDGKQIPKIKDWTKRNDHRHHAMDALTVAFTKPTHIQYLNYLSARKDESHKRHSNIYAIENKETFVTDKKKRIIKPPIPIQELRAEVKKHLENTLISFKAKNKVVTQNTNKTKSKNGFNKQPTLTPRGKLHKETIYGSSLEYVTKIEKVGPKFTEELIRMVAKQSYRDALLKRLEEFDGVPKKAFGGKNALAKKPIFLDEHQSEQLPEKVKLVWQARRFTIRKDVSPDLKLEKVLDKGVKTVLEDRLRTFGGDVKKAFSNLEENPIWLNEEKGIAVKRVTITGINNAEALHHKKDHFGNEILDQNNKPIPVDFVSTGNNHHVAIYKDRSGALQEEVVSFYEAVARVNAGSLVVQEIHPEHPDWEFQFTMKQNEYFVFPNEESGFNPLEIDLLDENNNCLISQNLFRVQKIASKNYFFRHHLETTVENVKALSGIAYKSQLGLNGIVGIVKVRLNHLGKIVKVGE